MAVVNNPLKTKSRKRDLGRFLHVSGSAARKLDGSWVENPKTTNSYGATAMQVTASEGHPWSRNNDYPGEDVGGPFETTDRYYSTHKYGANRVTLEDVPKYNDTVYVGTGVRYYDYSPVLPSSTLVNNNHFQFPNPAPSSDSELNAWGTKAIALTKPTNSIANLSVSLAELMREGLPKSPGRAAWEDRARGARGAGSEYLNAQFGWLPLVSDIKDVSKAISQGGELWKQYQRDAGRIVRRRFEFDPVYSAPVTISSASGSVFPSPISYFFQTGGSSGTYTVTRHKRQRRWFSGAFTYYLPDRDSSSAVERLLSHSAKARYLYGLTLDPEVLWNLTPWSWALDWFANTGDVISNLTDMATDGLVLRYGYMMEETIVSHEHTLTGLRWRSAHRPANVTLYAVTHTKKRVPATPYGFGLTWTSFTPRQLSILAALGVTRGR